jgi:inner membrane protein
MYKEGHYGAALLVYAPFGYLLLAVKPMLALVGGAGVLALATLPDVDIRLPLIPHRGPTHTVAFALVVAGVLALAGWLVGGQFGAASQVQLAAFGSLVGAVGIGSHLFADMLTPMGVRPFWPWGPNISFSVTRAANPVANWVLLALGVFVTGLALLFAA